MDTTPLMTAALDAARRGWHVFPLLPGDKPPAIRNRAQIAHASTNPGTGSNATDDPRRIAPPGARRVQRGLATGPSGLVVVDLDRPKPGEQPPADGTQTTDQDGADVLAVLCERHGQPLPADTYTVRTIWRTAPVLPRTAGQPAAQHGRGHGLGWKVDTRAVGG